MNYDIRNLVNLSNSNALSSPMCISFELQNGDEVLGTCQFTLENISLNVEVVDDRGNQFSFKPGKELEKEQESFPPEKELHLSPADEEVTKKEKRKRKAFKCEICDKSYASKSSLKRHTQIHMKPVICRVWGRRCRDNFDLTEHKRTYTGEKAFQCNVCGKRFADISYRNFHQRKHTGENKITCEVCGKGFA